MKPTFKQFQQTFLNEMLRVENNKIVYTIQGAGNRTKEGSTSTAIDTAFQTGWYKEHTADSGNVDIYSCYLYKKGDVITDMLKSLKGSGPYTVEDKTYTNFLKNTAKRAVELIVSRKIDTIIFPKSSSKFLLTFIEHIQQNLGGHKVNIIADAIIKKQIKDVDVQKGDMTELINFDHPSFHTLKDSTIKSLEKQIARVIKQNQEDGKGAVVSLKDMPKMQAKFVGNFLELVRNLSDDLHDKNVLVVDDVLSSGATFAEMVRVLQKEKVKSLIGLTIFKNTSETKPKTPEQLEAEKAKRKAAKKAKEEADY